MEEEQVKEHDESPCTSPKDKPSKDEDDDSLNGAPSSAAVQIESSPASGARFALKANATGACTNLRAA